MGNDTKFVVILGLFEVEEMVIFNNAMTHADFKKLGKVISAGFICRSLDTKSGLMVYGSSASLNLKSRGEDDQRLLDKLLGEDYR